ncbi:FimB/Mfa2 family fimbrial subunit [Longitalea arenae]|uniref:FimB/Mfa2 family fimbrial subunit n=1 Tax=Longitalea arenae TaxID=2812558 RepID=UPI0019675740|nr:FimB/Mfa2 family fimbrial subunit [Longitalea arenae]
MKKLVPALLLASVLFACKKNTSTGEIPTNPENRYPVSFSVTNFLVETQSMRVATDASLSKITDVYYFAYGSDNLLKSSIHQDTANNKTGFGIIKDSLPAGTYTIVLYASNGPVARNGGANLNWADLGPQQINQTTVGSMPDVFFKKFIDTVTDAPSVNPQDVSLNRITGLLRVELYDALPASHPNGEVKLYVAPINGNYSFSSLGTTMGSKDVYGIRRNQTTFEEYLFGSPYTMWVHILYKDKVTGQSKSKTFENNIKVETNKKTIIKGYLYGAPDTTQGDFHLKVNTSFTDSTVINLN